MLVEARPRSRRAMRHGVDLDREAGRLARRHDPVQHLVDAAPAASRAANFVGVQRVEADTLTLRTPAAAPAPRRELRLSCVPFVVSGQLVQPPRRPAPPGCWKSCHHAPAHQRLAAGHAAACVVPSPTNAPHSRSRSSSESTSGLGRKVHVLGHAVDAAQVAAIRHRDAEIGDGAAERVDHRSGHGGGCLFRYGMICGNRRQCSSAASARRPWPDRRKPTAMKSFVARQSSCPATTIARSIRTDASRRSQRRFQAMSRRHP